MRTSISAPRVSLCCASLCFILLASARTTWAQTGTCAPTADGLACQQTQCPPGQTCFPSKVIVIPGLPTPRVIECECMSTEQCHLVPPPTPGALPGCQGPCPVPNFPCKQITNPTPNGIEVRCVCACETPTQCNDNDPCTTDTCNPATGECVHTPKDCNDNNSCTDDRCDPVTGNCLHIPRNCDDGDPCTDDSCNPTTGACSNKPKDCDDKDDCTIDFCDPETGDCRHIPVDCDDNDPCTEDTCVSTAAGTLICVHKDICQACCFPSGAPCQNLPPDVCQQLGGNPQPVGSNCTNVTCPPKNECGPTTDRHDCIPVTCPVADQKCVPSAVILHPNFGVIVLDCKCRDLKRCHIVVQPGTVPTCEGECPIGQTCERVTTQLTGGAIKFECICSPCKDEDCDDGDPCTKDVCNPTTGGCDHIPMDCDDRNPCTKDYCLDGVCKHDPVNCDDNNPCTDDRCNPDTGQCEHKPKDCADDDPCTRDYCDTATGQCKHDPVNCDDNNPCTVDKCERDPSGTGGFICTHTNICQACCFPTAPCQNLPPSVCLQGGGNPQGPGTNCTNTTCPPPTACGPMPDRHSCRPSICPPGQECLPTAIVIHPTLGVIVLDCKCRNVQRCHVVTVAGAPPHCEGGCPQGQICQERVTTTADGLTKFECICRPCTDADCDDGDPCTIDRCNPSTGFCQHIPINCDDNNPCTRDYCVNGQCVHDLVDCDDKDPCTIDKCNPKTGQCVHIPKKCDDGDPCTKDYCDPASGECKHDPVVCDDNNKCTLDGCVPWHNAAGYLCFHAITLCFDGDPCTTDRCDPNTGECVFTPVNCDDGNPCTKDKCVPDATGIGYICVHEQICEACCLPNNTCQDLLPAQCTQAGGTPQGPGSKCTDPNITCGKVSVPKFSQLPTPDREDIASNISFNSGNITINKVVADDFRSDGRLIASVRWWGSYLSPVYVPPQFTEPNAPPNHGQSPFAIDGWFISFHAPLNPKPNALPAPPLGLYFAPAAAVTITPAPAVIPCDGHPVYQYVVDLSNCCLIHSFPDTRLPIAAADRCPAQPDGFHEHRCFRYHMDIQAVVGATWVHAAGAVCCTRQATNNFAEIDFWGWHATNNERNVAPAFRSQLTIGTTTLVPCPPLNQCPPPNPTALYGPWANAPAVCSFQHRINMAFELLTNNPTTPLPCLDLVITSASSVKNHGAAPGTPFGINLPLTNPPGPAVEPRRGGVTQVRVTFSEAIMADDGSLDPGDEVTTNVGIINSLAISGDTLTVNLSGVPDTSCVRLVVENGIEGITTLGSDVLQGDNDVHVRSLAGDVTGNGQVNILDLNQCKNNLNQPLNAGNAKNDVGLNGSINILDLNEIKTNLSHAAAPCP